MYVPNFCFRSPFTQLSLMSLHSNFERGPPSYALKASMIYFVLTGLNMPTCIILHTVSKIENKIENYYYFFFFISVSFAKFKNNYQG